MAKEERRIEFSLAVTTHNSKSGLHHRGVCLWVSLGQSVFFFSGGRRWREQGGVSGGAEEVRGQRKHQGRTEETQGCPKSLPGDSVSFCCRLKARGSI